MAKYDVTNDETTQRSIVEGMLDGEIVAYYAAHVVAFNTPDNAPVGVRLLTVNEVAKFSNWQWWFAEKDRLN